MVVEVAAEEEAFSFRWPLLMVAATEMPKV
jgi:hypothetical protein